MELLFATNMREWGGGEQWMLSAAASMRARGHAVTLASPPGSVIERRALEKELENLPCGFVRDLDPISFWRVYRHCRDRKVDLLCLNMDRVLRIAGPAARLAGVPAVIPRRGSEFALKGHLNYRWHYQRVATGMLVNSKATRDTLCDGISWRPAGEIHILYNGLDLSPHANPRPRGETRAELGLGETELLLINVGELTKRKNAALLVRSMPALLEKRADTQLLLVGTGPEAQPLRELAEECGVGEHVHILGFRTDVADLLAASDLLIHCARVEGFGYAVAEAGAAGIPAVAARTSSVPEIVLEGQTGALFEDNSIDGLVAAAEAYLCDAALRERHGRAGRARVQTEFELDQQMEKLETIFEAECGLRA